MTTNDHLIMEFKSKYTNASEEIKLKFLDAIIQANEKLQAEFLNFASSKNEPAKQKSYPAFLELVKTTRQEFLEDFEQVDLENPDWDNYQPSHSGYIKEWEQYQQASEQEFDAIFDRFRAEAIDKIIVQKPDELTAMLIGIYEASQDAEITDEYDSFGDINEHLLDGFKAVMKAIIEKLGLAAISENTILAASQMFFNYCDEEYPGNTFFAQMFQDFLMTLAAKTSQSDQLLSLLDQSGVERKTLPELVLLLNKNTGNKDEWLQSARQFYLDNKEVARQLLEYYFENDKSEFLRVANELFENDKQFWSEYLKDYVSADLDKPLYVKVFYRLTVDEKKIAHYLQVRDYLYPEANNNLLTEIDGDKPFKVQILAAEKRYEEIKTIVETCRSDYEYADLIGPILEVYPEFCFNHIKQKAEKTLKTERGRHTYQRIVEWLKLADRIPGFKAEIRILARELYNYKPNLPALKDELRKGGLV